LYALFTTPMQIILLCCAIADIARKPPLRV
jgi:hypothetical protein